MHGYGFYCERRLYDGLMRNLERSCWFKRVLEMFILFAVTINFGGKCIPDFL